MDRPSVVETLRLATVLSAALAFTGAWRRSRVVKWQAFWPLPVMAFAVVLTARDLALIIGDRPPDPPTASLVLGVWTGLVVTLAGAIEVWSCRRGRSGGERLIAAALLAATGGALLIYHAAPPSGQESTGVESGILILVAGVLLATLRSMERPAQALHVLWPTALVAGALVQGPPDATDALAEAGREMDIVLADLRRSGAEVLPEAPATVTPFALGPVRMFRVDNNEVQIYLVAHDVDASPEAHLSPRVAIPSPIGGVPHLHVGPHILVLCVTADPRFARRLERIVRGLGGPRRQRSFVLATGHVIVARTRAASCYPGVTGRVTVTLGGSRQVRPAPARLGSCLVLPQSSTSRTRRGDNLDVFALRVDWTLGVISCTRSASLATHGRPPTETRAQRDTGVNSHAPKPDVGRGRRCP